MMSNCCSSEVHMDLMIIVSISLVSLMLCLNDLLIIEWNRHSTIRYRVGSRSMSLICEGQMLLIHSVGHVVT